MADDSTERECPFCKESIKAVAVICHYCQSGITPAKLDHAGVCPFCGESIKEDALKCRHCKSMLGPVPFQAGFRTTIFESCGSRCERRFFFGSSEYEACMFGCKELPR